MKYEGYKIGPVIRDIRKDKGLLIEEVAAKTGISVSTLGQVEQGGRNLSMKNLYMLMEVYETDANSLLQIKKYGGEVLAVTNGRQALRLVLMEKNAQYVPVRE